jgi:hypothetical protein
MDSAAAVRAAHSTTTSTGRGPVLSGRRAMRGALGRLTLLGLAASLTVALAHASASASFAASTADTGNGVTASGSFCVAKGTTSTVTSAGDSWTDEAAQASTHGGDPGLYVRSSSAGDRRAWVRFALPTPPAHCSVGTAVLSMYARTATATRTIDVYRGAATPIWASATISWGNQPGAVGPAVGSASLGTAGWQSWTVTAHVRDQYANVNNGFVLQDRAEGAGVAADQVYDVLESGATAPTLVVTWA